MNLLLDILGRLCRNLAPIGRDHCLKTFQNMKSARIAFSLSFVLVVLITIALRPTLQGQGSLTPPGAPAPSGKTLTQVEPRTDIATLSGTATAVYTIAVPGSYYLTSNLAGAAGKDTISVTVTGVTIDLNGFSLQSTDVNRAAILATSGASLTVRNGRLWPAPTAFAGLPVWFARILPSRAAQRETFRRHRYHRAAVPHQ